jgi:D-arabinose 1-dehydrogenase-like Zn-dependent alcohol dehydrogenase
VQHCITCSSAKLCSLTVCLRFFITLLHTLYTTLQQSLDLILNTISADHDVMLYQPLLRPNGTIVLLGLVHAPHSVPQVPLLMNRNAITGSLIGGVKRTQEIVDLCEEKKIYPDVVVVDCNKVDDIFEELQGKSTTVQRYVLDIANTMQDFMATHSKVHHCTKLIHHSSHC